MNLNQAADVVVACKGTFLVSNLAVFTLLKLKVCFLHARECFRRIQKLSCQQAFIQYAITHFKNSDQSEDALKARKPINNAARAATHPIVCA